MDADAIWAELRHINAQLESAPSADERRRLLELKADLQRRAKRAADDDVPTHTLERELEAAERRWAELQQERIDPVRQSGGDFGGDIKAGVDAIYMNDRIDAAQGRAEIEARIDELRRALDSRRTARD